MESIFKGKGQQSQGNVSWLIPFQHSQDLHDQIYCRDVVSLQPADRCAHLAMLLGKYLANIQADFYTPHNAITTGKRVTDILITVTSLLTAMKVSIAERLEKNGIPLHVNGETPLMHWLVQNYVFELGSNKVAGVNEVYDRNLHFTVAMPVHLYRILDSIEAIRFMQPSDGAPRSNLVNAAMHLWIQCVICHARHGHHSFISDMVERLREVESKSIHSNHFGLFPDYNTSAIVNSLVNG